MPFLHNKHEALTIFVRAYYLIVNFLVTELKQLKFREHEHTIIATY